MKKNYSNISWLLILFLIILIGLLIPSCGFIGLLFDGDDGNNSNRYYDVQISYNYSGGGTVSTSTPLVLLLIPLDSDMQFTDEGFNNATYVPNFFSPGVATVFSLESGPYAILGFIDDQPFGSSDGQLNMGEVYAFYDMKEFVGSIPQPDYIMVDSGIETWTPHFELDDSYLMDGFVVLAPQQGDTVYGEGIFIYMVGLRIDPNIHTIEVIIDADPPQAPFPADQEVFPVNMSTYGDGLYNLDIRAYDEGMAIIPFDQPPLSLPVSFNYVEPQ